MTANPILTTDEQPANPFVGVTITDPNANQTETATVTLSNAANGMLSGGAGGSISNGVYTVSGSASTVAADLDALVFTPTAHLATPGAVTVTLVNAAIVDTAGQTTSVASTVKATAVNDAPVISGTANVGTLGTTPVKPFPGVAITDPDTGVTETVTVTLSNAAAGSLSGAGITASGGGVYTVTGSIATVVGALQNAVFTPTLSGSKVVTTFTLSDVQSGLSGTPTSSAAPVSETVTATPANTPPVISGTVAGQTTVDDVPISPFSGVSVTDADAGAQDSLAITLLTPGGVATDADGTLSGVGLSKTGTGTYALAATSPATLSAELDKLVFTPTQAQVAAGRTVTTDVTLAASQTENGTTVTTANTATSVVVTALNYINGPAWGFAVIPGTPGQDVITAHGYGNVIFANGGNDFINAGSGLAAVNTSTGNTTVTLGGSGNLVTGGNGNNTVTGAPGGFTGVTLGDGRNTVSIGGSNDVILLGNGGNLVSGTQAMAFIATGSGNDTIVLGGSGNTVNAGGGSNTISGGTGQNTFVLPAAGQGYDLISGFTETNGDVLNLHAALAATKWNGQASALGNYLKVTDVPGATNLAIANTGSGGGTPVAQLAGAPGLGLADLLSHHALMT